MKKLFVLAIVICISIVQGYAQQTRKEIQKQQESLRQELADLNNSLSKIKKNRKLSLRELNLIQQKIRARQSLIKSINKELKNLDQTIANYNEEIGSQKKQLDTLKGKYAQSIVFAYKNRSNYSYINFLFSSNSFNDAFRRIAYLKSYRKFRESQATTIVAAQKELKDKIAHLENTKTDKNTALLKQGSQLKGLQSDRLEKDSAVLLLKGQEGDIKKEIASNAAKRRRLQNALQAVIRREIAEAERKEKARLAKIEKARQAEEERKRIAAQQKALADKQAELDRIAAAKKNEANNNTAGDNKSAVATDKENSAKTPVKTRPSQTETAKKEADKPTQEDKIAKERANRSYNVLESTTETLTQSLDFEKNKGKLPWPTTGGFVSSSFGVHSIPGTNLRQENNGIEISATDNNTIVKSVATGTVSVVIADGTYAVIIRVGKYFTTYSNLSSVNVQRGDKVDAGSIIGRMATDAGTGASTVFFMVTDSKGNPLNPMSWLGNR